MIQAAQETSATPLHPYAQEALAIRVRLLTRLVALCWVRDETEEAEACLREIDAAVAQGVDLRELWNAYGQLAGAAVRDEQEIRYLHALAGAYEDTERYAAELGAPVLARAFEYLRLALANEMKSVAEATRDAHRLAGLTAEHVADEWESVVRQAFGFAQFLSRSGGDDFAWLLTLAEACKAAGEDDCERLMRLVETFYRMTPENAAASLERINRYFETHSLEGAPQRITEARVCASVLARNDQAFFPIIGEAVVERTLPTLLEWRRTAEETEHQAALPFAVQLHGFARRYKAEARAMALGAELLAAQRAEPKREVPGLGSALTNYARDLLTAGRPEQAVEVLQDARQALMTAESPENQFKAAENLEKQIERALKAKSA